MGRRESLMQLAGGAAFVEEGGRTYCMVVSCPSNFCRAPDSLVTLSQAIRTSACMAHNG